MFQYVKRRGGVHEHEARWFFQQLIIGLDYCHRMGVVNRDIKLENTLLDGSKRPLVKICDFGYSKSEKDSLPKSKVGTPGYTGGSDMLCTIPIACIPLCFCCFTGSPCILVEYLLYSPADCAQILLKFCGAAPEIISNLKYNGKLVDGMLLLLHSPPLQCDVCCSVQ